MNAYVTVDGVKMTKLYPEGGAEAPPVADAAKICWRPRCAATRIRAPKYAPGKFFSLRSRPIDPLPAKTKKRRIHESVSFFLERATRLELATSTLARSRSTR